MLEGFGKELDLSSDYTEGEEESEDDETTIKEHEGDQVLFLFTKTLFIIQINY